VNIIIIIIQLSQSQPTLETHHQYVVLRSLWFIFWKQNYN